MSKRLCNPALITASILMTATGGNSYRNYEFKDNGSAIYIPKRHKYKAKNKPIRRR